MADSRIFMVGTECSDDRSGWNGGCFIPKVLAKYPFTGMDEALFFGVVLACELQGGADDVAGSICEAHRDVMRRAVAWAKKSMENEEK